MLFLLNKTLEWVKWPTQGIQNNIKRLSSYILTLCVCTLQWYWSISETQATPGQKHLIRSPVSSLPSLPHSQFTKSKYVFVISVCYDSFPCSMNSPQTPNKQPFKILALAKIFVTPSCLSLYCLYSARGKHGTWNTIPWCMLSCW